jgi:hypothetical protein
MTFFDYRRSGGGIMGSSLIALNGAEAWAYVVELDDGLRVRFALDDWLQLNVGIGQRVPVRLLGKADVWLFITHVTELPPVVWVIMSTRVRDGAARPRPVQRSSYG